jgi:hypothetical protein
MDATIFVSVISATAAVAVAALSYAFKRREREAEWRKLKLEHYKEYISVLLPALVVCLSKLASDEVR